MVVDSSIWLEILLEGKLREVCRKAIDTTNLRIPSVCLYEIYKKLKVHLSESEALEAVGALSPFTELVLTKAIALLAADLSIEYDLAMADSIVLAHARYLDETLVTLDNDFAKIPGAKVLR